MCIRDSPWTNDPVFRVNYFCNIFREDDRVTRWFRDNIREPLRNDYRVARATVLFRWFNFIPTGELIKDVLLGDQSLEGIEAALRPLQQRGEKLFTSAFMIHSPIGSDKLTGILDCLRWLPGVLGSKSPAISMQGFATQLQKVNCLGDFMAYQVVCDLRYTSVLENAPDIMTWTTPGPGSIRALHMLGGNTTMAYKSAKDSYRSKGAKSFAIGEMRKILERSRDPNLWPREWRPWELSTVQHSLCEYSKWLAGKAGEHLKRRYPQC